MFALVVKIKAIKGKENDIERILIQAMEKVRQNESDTLIYDLHRKIDDKTDIVMYERYKDRDAWAITHMSKSYIKELLQELADYLDGDPVIGEYEVVETL